ncbi:hypothetical protein [Streptomyces sp. NPDC051567]|uniref:hypothetical protein n=1 Tax=Streptomyces sp. NPDC051567 TaxID=3365660 RepID=UPI003791F40B
MSKKPNDFQVDTGGVSAMLTGLSGRFGTEPSGQGSTDGMTASRHAVMPSVEPPLKPSKYTLLLDQDDALTLDQLALTLRRRTGRPVDKSEILRALIRLADTTSGVTDSLAQVLDRRRTEPS